MNLVSDSLIRSVVLSYLTKKNVQFSYNNDTSKSFSIDEIDGVGDLINESISSSKKDTRKYLNKELSTAYLGVEAAGILSLCIDDKDDHVPIDINWAGKDTVSPNFTIHKLIVQFTNYALSAVHLIQIGQENPAKAIMRSLNEISWLTLVLLVDVERYKLYAQDLERKEEKKIWSEYFSFKNLNSVLIDIEKKIGIPEYLIDKMCNIRAEEYGLYSQSLHNSYVSSTLGSLAKNPENTEILQTSLFGKFSIGLKSVIDILIETLFYTIGAIPPVLEKYHDFKIPGNDYPWCIFSVLRSCFTCAYLNLKKSESKDE